MPKTPVPTPPIPTPSTPPPDQEPSQPSSPLPPTDPQSPEPKVYDEDYVKGLRDEAAANRVKATSSQERLSKVNERLLAATVKATCKDLQDPTDLIDANVDLVDEDGLPDDAKILAAQAELLARKPHLKARTVTGTLEQGGRETPAPAFSFNDWLRDAAG